MNVLSVVRLVVFVSTIVFSIISLGLAAHLTSVTLEYRYFYLYFAVLAIATAVLSIISLPVMLAIDISRSGAFTSMLVVELVWLFVLWALWLSTGADAANAYSIEFIDGCSLWRGTLTGTVCAEFQAIQAFAFLNWIILFVYSCVLLGFAIQAASQGRSGWTRSVKDYPWTKAQSGEEGEVPV